MKNYLVLQCVLTVLWLLNFSFDYLYFSLWLLALEGLQMLFIDNAFRIAIPFPCSKKGFLVFPYIIGDEKRKFVITKFHIWKEIVLFVFLGTIFYYTITYSKIVLPISIVLSYPIHEVIKRISPYGKPKGYVIYDTLDGIGKFLLEKPINI